MTQTPMNRPIISVIMSVYNSELYLRETIESVLSQTFSNFELIIVDDGSIDGSLTIIQEFIKRDSRVRCISRENRGLISSLNEALEVAAGLFVARMDADDICYPTRFASQHSYMEENRLDICGGDYITIRQDGSFLRSNFVPKRPFEILLTLGCNVPFAHPSVMIRRSFLIENKLNYGAYESIFAEDIGLWMAMYEAGARFGNSPGPLIKYRRVKTSVSHIHSLAIKKEVLVNYDRFVKNNLYDIKIALSKFCNLSYSEDMMERSATKTLLRYLKFDFDFLLLCQIAYRIRTKNFAFGIASYIKSRILL